MQIRNINADDIKYLRVIWSNYFQHEFEFPDFLNGYLSNFVITDENDSPIVAGGLRPLLEIVLLTDKSQSVEDRYLALNKVLEYSKYSADKLKFDSIHAFIQDESWYYRLIKTGFKPTKGSALVMEI